MNSRETIVGAAGRFGRRTPVRALVLVSLFSVSASQATYLYYSAEGTVTFDSNIPQNITEYAGWYAVPQVYLKVRNMGGFEPLSLWGRSSYGNYLQTRSALLAPPFLSGGVSLDMGKKRLFYDIGLSVASYNYPDLRPARIRYQLANALDLKIARHRLGAGVDVAYNDYGDDGLDGVRLTVEGAYAIRPKVLKGQTVGLRESRVVFTYERNGAQSDTSSYNSVAAKVGCTLKLAAVDLEVFGRVRYKRFDGQVEDTKSAGLINAENRYLYLGGALESDTRRGLSAGAKGLLRFKDSTYGPYEYDRHTIGLFVKWSGTAGKK